MAAYYGYREGERKHINQLEKQEAKGLQGNLSQADRAFLADLPPSAKSFDSLPLPVQNWLVKSGISKLPN
jgi:hypothetical protein